MWTATVVADTLVLRNGTRVSGRLIGLRDGVFEFEEDRGNRRRVIRVEQAVRAHHRDRPGRAQRLREQRRPAAAPARAARARSHGVGAPAVDRHGHHHPQRADGVLEASGRIRWGRERQDGPEGQDISPRNPNRPMPSRPAAALIGRVGEDAAFLIGTGTEGIRVRGSGQLFLGVNDETLEDNSGSFRVTVYY